MADSDFEISSRIEEAVHWALDQGWNQRRVRDEVQNAFDTFEDES